MDDSELLIVLIKPIDDPKVQYIIAKMVHKSMSNKPFAEIFRKIKSGDSIIALKTESPEEASEERQKYENFGATVQINTQKTIGGAKVY